MIPGDDEVRVDIEDTVMLITIDRPKANAIDLPTSRKLGEALVYFRDNVELKVAIITGGGEKIFCAGWDLKEIAAFDNNEDALNSAFSSPGGFAGISEFWGLKKPVISAINGMAVGGGFEIALATDLVIAADHAEFFLPEMQRGFLPVVGAIQILPRKLPYNVAMDLLYTGRRMSAQEALQWGFVCRVCPASELMEQARAFAREVALGAPLRPADATRRRRRLVSLCSCVCFVCLFFLVVFCVFFCFVCCVCVVVIFGSELC